MKPRTRKLLWLAAEILVVAGVYFGIQAWRTRTLPVGPAPSFNVETLAGQRLSLDDYRGRAVLVHFWATWCPVCHLEQPNITAVARDWPVITVAMQSGDAKHVRQYLKKHGLGWTVIVDESGELSRRFGVQAVPTDFVIGPQGTIRFAELGYSTTWGLRARLWWAAHAASD